MIKYPLTVTDTQTLIIERPIRSVLTRYYGYLLHFNNLTVLSCPGELIMSFNITTGQASAGIYGVSVIQRLLNSRVRWANNWYVQFREPVSAADYEAFATRLTAFHIRLLFGIYFVETVRISTFQSDTDPYNADEFVSYNFNTQGILPANSEALSLDVCLYLVRDVPTGRDGKLFLRGCLEEAEVTTSAGRFVLNNPVAWGQRVSNAVSQSELNVYFAAGSNENIKLVLPPRGAVPLRVITSLTPKGVSINKQDRRYYDRD